MKIVIAKDKMGGFNLRFVGLPAKMVFAIQRAIHLYGMHCYVANEVSEKLDVAVGANQDLRMLRER